MFEVRKAKRQRRPLKISLEGLSGSGKTFTALRLAFALKRAAIGKKIVVADSENESAGLYAGVTMDGETWDFETCSIPHQYQTPNGYAECYEHLVAAGFDLIIMDSLSHAWHGAMEQVDRHAQANKGDKFGGWAKISPEQRKMLTTLTDPRAHLIATMRVKSEYERIDNGQGKTTIKKVGMKTDQRENTEYEFDAVIRLEVESHAARVEKVRGCTAMDGKTGDHPGPTFWKPLIEWWLSAEEAKSLHEELLAGIEAATSQKQLFDAFGRAFRAREAQQINEEQYKRIEARKDELKPKFAPAPAPQAEPAAAPAPVTTPDVPKPLNLDAAIAKLRACTDMPALAAFWQSLEDHPNLQKALVPERDKKKAELKAAGK